MLKSENFLEDRTTKYGVLALKGCAVFEGRGFGAYAKTWGEVVFTARFYFRPTCVSATTALAQKILNPSVPG
ncbi:MAG: hypothetical protein PHQ25_07540 [Acidobacteriota bacterium]|nr:hypothetical protein [Acidobacteriota bacterium]MDY0232196.1 hypothetical protein [Candidatus Saccharicenans sp.]